MVSPREGAIFDKLQNSMGLELSQERRADILALITAKAKMDRRSRSGEAEKAKAECKKVRAAAETLIAAISGGAGTSIDWADAIRTQCIVQAYTKSDVPKIGNEFSEGPWKYETIGLMQCIAEVSKARARDLAENPKPAGQAADRHARMFAQTLFHHFIRSGGKAGNNGPLGGFSSFLILIWELLPDDCRPGTAEAFSRRHNDAVLRHHYENRSAVLAHGRDIGTIGARCCPAEADYAIQLTKGYWGIAP